MKLSEIQDSDNRTITQATVSYNSIIERVMVIFENSAGNVIDIIEFDNDGDSRDWVHHAANYMYDNDISSDISIFAAGFKHEDFNDAVTLSLAEKFELAYGYVTQGVGDDQVT